ncbi:MAG: adenylate/guanylate cyclase domain-containing protein, partial [Mycobacterium sp.]
MSSQSKVMVMLLVSSILSVAVIGFIGYESGRNALRNAVSQRLIELRDSQTRAVAALFADLANSQVIYSRDPTAVEALQAFTAGFDQLANATINPAQQQAIVNY